MARGDVLVFRMKYVKIMENTIVKDLATFRKKIRKKIKIKVITQSKCKQTQTQTQTW